MSGRASPARCVAAAAALCGALAAQASGRLAIVSEQQLAQDWLPAPEAQRYVAGYPAAASDKSLDVCIALGYEIGADGATSNFVVLRSWSSASPEGVPNEKAIESYVQTAAAVVSMWRYLPAGKKPRPVYTATAFAFPGNGGAPAAPEALRERCRIGDLAAFVAEARNAAWLKQNIRGSDRVRKPNDMYDRHPNQRLGADNN